MGSRRRLPRDGPRRRRAAAVDREGRPPRVGPRAVGRGPRPAQPAVLPQHRDAREREHPLDEYYRQLYLSTRGSPPPSTAPPPTRPSSSARSRPTRRRGWRRRRRQRPPPPRPAPSSSRRPTPSTPSSGSRCRPSCGRAYAGGRRFRRRRAAAGGGGGARGRRRRAVLASGARLPRAAPGCSAPWHGGVMKGCVRRTKAALGGTRYDFYIELPGHRLFVMAAAKPAIVLGVLLRVHGDGGALARLPHYLGSCAPAASAAPTGRCTTTG